MKKLYRKITNIFAAVAFAEQAEWEEAVRITEEPPDRSSLPRMEKDQQQPETRQRKDDHRPRLRV